MAKSETQKLKEKADRIFSKYIRLKWSDPNGYCRCVTCGKKDIWTRMHAGHFVLRRHMSCRYREDNVHPQCVYCNSFQDGNASAYAVFLEKEYGDGILQELEQRKYCVAPYGKDKLEEIIDKYEPLVKKQEKRVIISE